MKRRGPRGGARDRSARLACASGPTGFCWMSRRIDRRTASSGTRLRDGGAATAWTSRTETLQHGMRRARATRLACGTGDGAAQQEWIETLPVTRHTNTTGTNVIAGTSTTSAIESARRPRREVIVAEHSTRHRPSLRFRRFSHHSPRARAPRSRRWRRWRRTGRGPSATCPGHGATAVPDDGPAHFPPNGARVPNIVMRPSRISKGESVGCLGAHRTARSPPALERTMQEGGQRQSPDGSTSMRCMPAVGHEQLRRLSRRRMGTWVPAPPLGTVHHLAWSD